MLSLQELQSLSDKDILIYTGAKQKKRKLIIPTEALNPRFYAPSTNFNIAIDPIKVKRISKGERECKRVLEEYFQKPFYRVRPKELKGLELDCFNPSLGIACEYNGIQHYSYPSRYIKRKKEFIRRLRRDLYKIAICRKIGITLIVVPYIIKTREIKEFILGYL